MEGLQLADEFATADQCRNNLEWFLDEWIGFQNNITEVYGYTNSSALRVFDPWLNLTSVFGGNISESVVNCTLTGLEVYDWGLRLYTSASNSLNNLLVNWMFAQMANSLKYKKAVDRIRENELAQNYILNAQQFGLICNYFFL